MTTQDNNRSIHDIYDRYTKEERVLAGKILALEGELNQLKTRLDESRALKDAAAVLLQASGIELQATSPPSDATAPAESAQTHTAAGPRARAAAPPSTRRKGRRAVRGTAPAAASNARPSGGIVDAAITYAKANGVRVANAGEILDWFEANSFRTRSGTLPSRNSVYVSLNRECTEGPKRGKVRISRPARGRFEFHYD